MHLLLLISVVYLPMFAYSLALDFDRMDAMCASVDLLVATEPIDTGSEDGADDYIWPWFGNWWRNVCGDKIWYEMVGTVCIFLQVCLPAASCTVIPPATD